VELGGGEDVPGGEDVAGGVDVEGGVVDAGGDVVDDEDPLAVDPDEDDGAPPVPPFPSPLPQLARTTARRATLTGRSRSISHRPFDIPCPMWISRKFGLAYRS
jgi:hypothetical protein